MTILMTFNISEAAYECKISPEVIVPNRINRRIKGASRCQ